LGVLYNIIDSLTYFTPVFGLSGVFNLRKGVLTTCLSSTGDGGNLAYSSSLASSESLATSTLRGSTEISSNYRLQRHQLPIFKADFKAGNFFPKNDLIRRPALFMTSADLTKGTRKPL